MRAGFGLALGQVRVTVPDLGLLCAAPWTSLCRAVVRAMSGEVLRQPRRANSRRRPGLRDPAHPSPVCLLWSDVGAQLAALVGSSALPWPSVWTAHPRRALRPRLGKPWHGLPCLRNLAQATPRRVLRRRLGAVTILPHPKLVTSSSRMLLGKPGLLLHSAKGLWLSPKSPRKGPPLSTE